jgi:hypothetical protein
MARINYTSASPVMQIPLAGRRVCCLLLKTKPDTFTAISASSLRSGDDVSETPS